MPHFPIPYNVSHCLSTRTNPHLKVDKVLRGTAAWDNVDLIEDHNTLHAYFMLIQTSSTDEPMVTFYKCCADIIEETRAPPVSTSVQYFKQNYRSFLHILMHAARNFALQEHAINNSESNLKKLQLISAHLGYQQESLMKSSLLVEEVKEQVRAMQR